jgi:hypothetical protein
LNSNIQYLNTDTTFILNKLGKDEVSYNPQLKKAWSIKINNTLLLASKYYLFYIFYSNLSKISIITDNFNVSNINYVY